MRNSKVPTRIEEFPTKTKESYTSSFKLQTIRCIRKT
jgi:hypothetical protein